MSDNPKNPPTERVSIPDKEVQKGDIRDYKHSRQWLHKNYENKDDSGGY